MCIFIAKVNMLLEIQIVISKTNITYMNLNVETEISQGLLLHYYISIQFCKHYNTGALYLISHTPQGLQHFPDQGLNLCPCVGSVQSKPLDPQGGP